MLERDLRTGKRHTEDDVSGFAFLPNHLAAIHAQKEAGSRLTIMDISGRILQSVADVKEFAVNAAGSRIAISGTAGYAAIMNLNDGSVSRIASENDKAFTTLLWSKDGNALSFIAIDKNAKQRAVCYYDLETKQLYSAESNTLTGWDASYNINVSQAESLTVSDDGKRVFFRTRREVGIISDEKRVKVWNATDSYLTPYRERLGKQSDNGIGCWWPESNKFIMLSGEGLQVHRFNGNQEFAITSDASPYLPTIKFSPDRDYYVTNLKTGKTELLLKQQLAEFTKIKLSPDGRYAFYFRDHHWWSYDFYAGVHTNLTASVAVPFEDLGASLPEALPNYGIGGYTKDGYVLLYDAFDIWKIKPGSVPRRLTRGRESAIVYRIADDTLPQGEYRSELFSTLPDIGSGTRLFLQSTSQDKQKTGYALLDGNTTTNIIYESHKFSELMAAANGKDFICLEQDYDSPPAIIADKVGNGKPKLLYQSNPQHRNYNWGRSEHIDFKYEDGTGGSATLFYPFDYDAGKKYPMLVNIYEDLSHDIHNYVNPSLHNVDGYNVTNFTSNGYFVLHPNIKFKSGYPGPSALNAVTAAVAATVKLKNIDAGKIGLNGHSFGGYETMFIVTRTNIFAAAVAGSGVADVTGFYLSMSKNYLKPEGWRSEFAQWRTGTPLFGNFAQFADNSPLTGIENVTTPTLTWAGEHDVQIDPYQSMEFYMAMRRLGKEHIMLRYPEEEHVLFKEENQKDLTVKIMQWFDYYLKGMQKPDWTQSN